MNKKFVLLVCVALAFGLFVGLLSFASDFTPPRTYNVKIDADMIHAYFHVFNVSKNSGISGTNMVTYVFVFNVTNPTDYGVWLQDIRVELALNGSQVELAFNGTSYSFSGGYAVTYFHRFSESDLSGGLQPHESKLLGVVGTGALDNGGMKVFNASKGYFLGNLYYAATEGNDGARVIVFKELPLQLVSTDEYVYGGMFQAGDYVYFSGGSTIVDLSIG